MLKIGSCSRTPAIDFCEHIRAQQDIEIKGTLTFKTLNVQICTEVLTMAWPLKPPKPRRPQRQPLGQFFCLGSLGLLYWLPGALPKDASQTSLENREISQALSS